MSIDRDLLWKAWPDGFLPMRGVSTIGGYLCERTLIGDRHVSVWIPPKMHRGYRFLATTLFGSRDGMGIQGPTGMASIKREEGCYVEPEDWGDGPSPWSFLLDGEMLPNVDPADAATWACVLDNLRRSLGWLVAENEVCNLSWSQPAEGPKEWSTTSRGWRLERQGDFLRPAEFHYFGIATDSPALALVLARIQLREAQS